LLFLSKGREKSSPSEPPQFPRELKDYSTKLCPVQMKQVENPLREFGNGNGLGTGLNKRLRRKTCLPRCLQIYLGPLGLLLLPE
jgi:hypothetical protein